MIYLIISFLASVVGAICGIGGGVIIKPCLDMLSLTDASTANFLSGCTVLSMTTYSVFGNIVTRGHQLNVIQTTPLAVGAAVGGVVGKQILSFATAAMASAEVKRLQAMYLLFVTAAAFLYTLNKHQIASRNVKSKYISIMIGLLLGIMSSFLGIGGGPVNLVVLYYAFGMDTKEAAQNSLYVILFSQLASLLTTVVSGSIPPVELTALLLMIAGGILGGITGRAVNKRVSIKTIDRLFKVVMILLMGLCIYNMDI